MRAFRQQTFDYLVKPVRPDELLRTLDRARERFHRRRAEAALRDSEEQMRRIFATVNDGLLITDDNGHIVQSHPAATRITGVAAEDLLGVDTASLLGPIAGEPPGAHLQIGLLREFALIRAGGDRRRVEVEVAAFAPDRLVHTMRDVTEQRVMQERLRLAQKMEALGRLAGGVAHDFNNVLTAIRGYADLLRERCVDPSMLEEVDEIRRASDRASDLTRQLLAFGRGQVLQPRILDLHALLAAMEGMLRRLIREDISLELKLPRTAARVRADPNQLEGLDTRAGFDLLITDIVLPGMSGWEIARRATQVQPDVRVLYMSGYAESDLDHGMIEPGTAFLAKPFMPSELSQRIRNILDGLEPARADPIAAARLKLTRAWHT